MMVYYYGISYFAVTVLLEHIEFLCQCDGIVTLNKANPALFTGICFPACCIVVLIMMIILMMIVGTSCSY